MGKYDAKNSNSRDDLFTPGQHFFVVDQCGIFPSTDPRKKGQMNYRIGGKIVQSKGCVARLNHKDGRIEDKEYPALRLGARHVDIGDSNNANFGPQFLGNTTKAIMDSLHLTMTGPASPVRTALIAALSTPAADGSAPPYSQKQLEQATARYNKTLKDEWSDSNTAEENAKAWVDVDQYFANGQGKNLVLRVDGKATITKENGVEICKVYIKGEDQAAWYEMVDGVLTPKFDAE